MPASLARSRVYDLAECMRRNNPYAGLAPPDISNQCSKQGQTDSKRRGPVHRIEQLKVLSVPLLLPTELFPQNCVVWVALGDTLSK